jgi:hypothetical protein
MLACACYRLAGEYRNLIDGVKSERLVVIAGINVRNATADVNSMVLRVLYALDFDLCRPTAFDFIIEYAALAGYTTPVEDAIGCMICLAAYASERVMSRFSPRDIARGALALMSSSRAIPIVDDDGAALDRTRVDPELLQRFFFLFSSASRFFD